MRDFIEVGGEQNTAAVIESFLTKENLHLSPEAQGKLVASLVGKLRIRPGDNRPLKFVAEDGREQDAFGHVSQLIAASEVRPSKSQDSRPAVGTADNPYRERTWNLTQQWLLEARDPEKADALQQLAKEADARKGDPNNPWSRDGWNLTSQMRLQLTDPERAAHLAAQEGVAL
jgi:hypothetical protein